MITRRSRPLSLLLAFGLAVAPLAAHAQDLQRAQAELAEGDRASHARDFAAALERYRAAQRQASSARAELGIAESLTQLGRPGEAYEAYQSLETTYGVKLSAAERDVVTRRLRELGAKTGWLSIRVNEAGAQVEVDGKPVGTSPVPTLMRYPVGTHEIHVTKPGFAPFAKGADVPADGKAVIEVALAPAANRGHVTVRASGTEALRVLVDDVDVGAAPWEGDLPPGPHRISGRSSTATAEVQTVDVPAGSRTAVELVSAATAAHLRVRTSDGKGVIYIDGVARGEGSFSGDLAPGPHTLVVTREGYGRFEKSVTLAERQTWADTVVLTQAVAEPAASVAKDRPYEGVYGGLGLLGSAGVGGTGTELETNCSTLGAVSCDTPGPLGAGLMGYLGWTWDPVGFELMLGGIVDQTKQKASFDASASTSSILPTATPARTETFTFVRFGGMTAARVRVAFQSNSLRGTLAGGPGLSFRQLIMGRETATTDGTNRTETYSPGAVTYLSPGLSAEASLQGRLSPAVAVSVGVFFWAENASFAGSNVAPPSTGHILVSPANPSAAAQLPTPQYHLATGPQVFLGPILGMQFGP